MLNELTTQWEECDIDEAEEFISQTLKRCWIPNEWYAQLYEHTDEPGTMKILKKMMN